MDLNIDLNISNGISLVAFVATWCKVSKKIKTTIQKVSTEFPDIQFHELDVDDNPVMAKKYKISSIPTVILFKDGNEITRILGSFKIDALRKVLRES